MPEKDPWETTSGLFSDYEGTVIDAWFGTDPNSTFNKDQVFLFLKLFTDHPDHETVEERYSVGPKWQTLDGGETVEHPEGQDMQFNGNTQYGEFINTAVAVGGGETVEGRKNFVTTVMKPRGSTKTAKTWVGTKWYMEGRVKEGKLQDGSAFKSTRNYPTKFLGVEGESPAAASTGATTSRTRPAVLDAIEPQMVESLREVALKCDRQPVFVDAAMELPGVLQNNDLVISLANPSLYEYLRSE